MSGIVGYVASENGTVEVTQENGEKVLLQSHMPVHKNDIIRTGDASSVELILDNGNTIKLGENKEIILDETVYEAKSFDTDEVEASVQSIQELLALNGDVDLLDETASGNEGVTNGSSNITDTYLLREENFGHAESDYLPTEIVRIVEPIEFVEAVVIPEEPTPVIPNLSINDVTVDEDAGTMTFTVTLSSATAENVTFNYVSSDQSANAGSDYSAVSGSGTIAAGTTTTTITVPISDDYIAEPSETFAIDLSDVSTNAIIDDGQGIGTILDELVPGAEDTATVTLSGAASVMEGSTATYTVSIDKAPITDMSIDIIISHIDTSSGDLLPATITVTIPAGSTSVNFSIDNINDNLVENNEDYSVTLTGVTSGGSFEELSISEIPVITTIIDNDATQPPPPPPTLPTSPVAIDDSKTDQITNSAVTLDVVANDTDDGTINPTTVTIIDATEPDGSKVVPGEGTWSVDPVTGAITFTPEAGFTNDPTPITYTVEDNDGNLSNPATVTIDYAVQPPVASDDSSTGNETGTPVTIDVLANDSDPDGNLDPSTVTIIGADPVTGELVVPGEGTWSVDPTTGAITFTPEDGFTSDPTPISYTVADNDGNVSDPATISVDYNNPPFSNDGNITMIEDTVHAFVLDEFGFTDPDGTPIEPTAIRIDSLPVEGELYYNGVIVSVTGMEIDAADIGLLTFVPFEHDSGSDEYSDDIADQTSVGDQFTDYANFEFSVNDGTQWSDTTATMTIDVTADADVPLLNVDITQAVTQTIDMNNVSSIDSGFTVTGRYIDASGLSVASVDNISTHSDPDGFGVLGVASGDADELGYLDGIGSEEIIISFDQAVASVDISFAWKHSTESAYYEFYKDGVKVGEGVDLGGSDGVDPAITLAPADGSLFDEIVLAAPNSGDDYLIHSISFDKVESVGNAVATEEGTPVTFQISSSLIDTDNSESLAVTISDIPEGAILSDGTNTVVVDSTGVIDITTWNWDTLSINVPNVDVETTYTLLVTATSTEYSNGDSESVQLPIQLTVYDYSAPVDPVLNDNSDIVYEAALVTGTDSSSTAEITTGNILSDDILPAGSALTDVSIVGGITDTSIPGTIIVTTAEGNILFVDAVTGAYAYTLVNNIDHPTANGNNSVIDQFTYTVTDAKGVDWTADLHVEIVDDVPQAVKTSIDLSIEPVVTNLSFIVDMSSSMDTTDRDLVKASIDELILQYDAIGTVNINVVEFWGNNHSNSGWQDATYDYQYVTGTSGTDIEQGLSGMVNESYSGNQPAADQDIMYFFGDGNTYGDYEADFLDYLPTWNDFVTGGDIDKLFSYSVNTSIVLDDIVILADNGENIVSKDPINISDISDLEDAVSETVAVHAEGNIIEENGVAIIDYGADGGHIQTIEIDGNNANYDADNLVQSITTSNGVFEINFETGAYTYIPTVSTDYTETVNVSIVDGDGDTLNAILLDINISFDDGGIHLTPNDDYYDMGKAIGVIVHAEGGDDTIVMRGHSHAENFVYGGEGEDTLILDGYRAEDENYNIVNNNDGTYTISYDGNHAFEVTIKDIEHIRFDEDSTSYTLQADGNYHLDTDSAVILDAIVAGLEYTTSSGLYGITDADGSFDYVEGDTVTFKIGNVTIGSIDMDNISDNQVFLQDLASVDRKNMNNEYLENMAVLLQSLDVNGDAYDGIVITEAMREAFLDKSFDLKQTSEDELREIIEETGRVAVTEEDAMTHVQDVLEDHTDVIEFDQHIDDDVEESEIAGEAAISEEAKLELDFVLEEEESLDFEQVGTPEFANTLNLAEDENEVELTFDDILTMTDNNELVILGDSSDAVNLKDSEGHSWIKSDSSVVENGHTFDVYESGDMIVKVEQDINDTIV